MDAISLRTNRFKLQLSKFSGIISRELSRPKQRLIKEMFYGIQASKDVKLSNIARSLQEKIPLIKTEDRLSRNLADEDFTEIINERMCVQKRCMYPMGASPIRVKVKAL